MASRADRIRLAEAIGDDLRSYKYSMSAVIYDLDPFTYANDDYAVLEWVRAGAIDWGAFVKALPHQNMWHFVQQYQIGDYARAALKVIDNGK